MKTGGGKPEYIQIDGPEKVLLEVLNLPIHGRRPRYDSDNVLPETTITGEASVVEIEPPIEMPSCSYASHASMEIFESPVDASTTVLTGELNSEQLKPLIIDVTDQILVEKSNISNDVASEEKLEPDKPKDATVVIGNGEESLTNNEMRKIKRSQSWKNWSPAALKRKKHPALIPRKPQREDAQKKLSSILELREELLRQEIHHIQEEERRAQEKHEKEMKLLDLNISTKS